MTELRPLGRADAAWEPFLAALREANLPTDDLDGGARFFVMSTDSEANAFGGLEGSGSEQLIRSVVVPESARGQGHGRRMTEALARRSRADGAERLWLLTTSADRFFAELGWTVSDRASAPETVRGTRQFADLCPSSAVLMCRHLL